MRVRTLVRMYTNHSHGGRHAHREPHLSRLKCLFCVQVAKLHSLDASLQIPAPLAPTATASASVAMPVPVSVPITALGLLHNRVSPPPPLRSPLSLLLLSLRARTIPCYAHRAQQGRPQLRKDSVKAIDSGRCHRDKLHGERHRTLANPHQFIARAAAVAACYPLVAHQPGDCTLALRGQRPYEAVLMVADQRAATRQNKSGHSVWAQGAREGPEEVDALPDKPFVPVGLDQHVSDGAQVLQVARCRLWHAAVGVHTRT